ncbi:MAG: hypothetical protein ACRDSR_06695 [Pseudonocardiaceae bacterium]
MSYHDDDFRFYRVLSGHIPDVGRCTTQVELVGDRLVLRPDTTSWFEIPLDYPAARCLLDALTGDTPGIVHARHPQHGATTVAVALHGPTASLRVENTSKGTLHVVFDETQLPELIMHLEDGLEEGRTYAYLIQCLHVVSYVSMPTAEIGLAHFAAALREPEARQRGRRPTPV